MTRSAIIWSSHLLEARDKVRPPRRWDCLPDCKLTHGGSFKTGNTRISGNDPSQALSGYLDSFEMSDGKRTVFIGAFFDELLTDPMRCATNINSQGRSPPRSSTFASRGRFVLSYRTLPLGMNLAIQPTVPALATTNCRYYFRY